MAYFDWQREVAVEIGEDDNSGRRRRPVAKKDPSYKPQLVGKSTQEQEALFAQKDALMGYQLSHLTNTLDYYFSNGFRDTPEQGEAALQSAFQGCVNKMTKGQLGNTQVDHYKQVFLDVTHTCNRTLQGQPIATKAKNNELSQTVSDTVNGATNVEKSFADMGRMITGADTKLNIASQKQLAFLNELVIFRAMTAQNVDAKEVRSKLYPYAASKGWK